MGINTTLLIEFNEILFQCGYYLMIFIFAIHKAYTLIGILLLIIKHSDFV